jgi:hypothetical protein
MRKSKSQSDNGMNLMKSVSAKCKKKEPGKKPGPGWVK